MSIENKKNKIKTLSEQYERSIWKGEPLILHSSAHSVYTGLVPYDKK